ncbi:hypothetical protein CWC17_14605 [Pseudoalteromonas sp. S3785]|uniref:hypothetical protein n=1 Tax=Pseudoalteromonas sp. S3785 TaxID=579545 RepID=UPI00110BFF1D|nr:hypothetical protein [Pseudoalteromonas sp. S3785]TMO72162.1 hypothetical protein CWC17_14605 [Pseudoalteromonas sp. S3785]
MNIEGKKIYSTKVYFAHKLLFYIARKAADKSTEEPEEAIVSLIFSFNCIEAFINETIGSTELFTGGRRTEAEQELYEQMLSLQSSKASTLEKYKKSKKLFTKNHWDRTQSPYKEFETLRNLRNSIIHKPPEVIKGELTIGQGEYNYKSKYERPDVELQELLKLGIIKPILRDGSWLDAIMTPELAEWSCQVAFDVINNFLTSLHEGRFKELMIEQMSLSIND